MPIGFPHHGQKTIPHGSLAFVPRRGLARSPETIPHRGLARLPMTVPHHSLAKIRLFKGNCGKCVVTNLPRALPRRTLKIAGNAHAHSAACLPPHRSKLHAPPALPRGRGRSPADWEGRPAAWENQESRRSKVESREGRASSRPQWPGRSRALPSKNFPTRRRRFPNLMRRGEVARSGCGRMMLASMRRHLGRWLAQRDGAPVSQLRRGSAMNAHGGDC